MKPATPFVDQSSESALYEDDVVSLLAPLPEAGLDQGVWGTVSAVYEDGTCEVEFTDREGHLLQVKRLPAEMLELVWSEE